ncbi:(S)-1-Phenylethanol dehydrogenase (plasmid) [Variovorax sp. SRS16]|uniref:SDR family oxidoreductase n=1 Tax=Variovorax sp. SRS16 TaxID=282217 RepID=UPI001318260D|nr:SDR family oxidoreductase [Variovorax sp. SRS16]VTU46335.1 (S)-1-Phenylethanol dehydrogenase [Variovorax sp. SRS16]
MDLQIHNRFAVVGGASQGLGYAIAERLAQEGAAVAMVARHLAPLQEACTAIREKTGALTVPIQADIRKADDCGRILQEAVAAFGRIDILVNNDGAPPLGELEQFDDVAWDKAVQQNLMSVVRLSRGAVPYMKQAGMGRIINVTALTVLQPLPGFGLSASTWAGVLAYAKTLSLEAGRHGVTVNSICPGRFATGRVARTFATGDAATGILTPEQMAQMSKDFPIPRLGDPAELAALVAFLCSPWAGYITGHVFHVDGGRRASLI